MDDAKYQKRDLTSEKLAQKMLQGWTMMGCHCPQCFTPFMRNKDEMLYCVQCEQYAVFEDEQSTKDLKVENSCDTKMREAQSTSSEANDGVAVKRAMDDSVERDIDLLPFKKRLIASIYQKMEALLQSGNSCHWNENMLNTSKSIRELAEVIKCLET